MLFRLLSRALVAALVLFSCLVTFGSSSALAAGTTYFVSGGGSDGVSCAANGSSAPFATIQRALLCAGPGDVVSLAASGKPYPGIGTIATAGVTVEGPSARKTSIDAGKGELTVVPGADLTISGVTLKCQTSCAGTPTVTNEGDLVLSGDAVTGNVGIPASAILSTTAAGSSIPTALTIRDSTISGNDSHLGGGVQTNTGAGATGASTATIIDSTIAGNVALQQGGGIAALATAPGSEVAITGSTITANTGSSGGGLFASSPVTLSNSILAGNTAHPGGATDCQSSAVGSVITDGPGGHNLIGNAAGCGAIVAGLPEEDQTGVTHPGLLPLANNGGATNTVALLAASPAIGTGDSATCTSADIGNLDQRGDPRVTASRGCDIGALDSAGKGVVHKKYFVAPSGSDAPVCTANRAAAPFATAQRALACATDGDVISLAPSGGMPYPGIGTVAADVTIEGASARTVSVDAGQGELAVAPGASPVLKGVSLVCATDCGGRPSVTDEGRLLLSADAVTGNTSLASSAILVTTPDNSVGSAALTVADSTLSGDDSTLGGAIQTTTGTGATGASTLVVSDSTIADNVALQNGGGIAAVATTPGSGATIVNSTITGNTASAGGGLWASSPVALSNTIVARNMAHLGAPADCQSSSGDSVITDGPGGHNLVGDDTGCGAITAGGDGDQAGSAASPLDPRLGPLAYNGGTTETERPLSASPAIGAGSAASCEQQPVFDLDQRLVSRRAPARDACDAGAVDTGGKK
ncbi:MAG TPA: right-handed parallel beta-helix repeat-containing protein [Solirubrobacteraceae bacterium]|jgi:hypothetical protein